MLSFRTRPFLVGTIAAILCLSLLGSNVVQNLWVQNSDGSISPGGSNTTVKIGATVTVPCGGVDDTAVLQAKLTAVGGHIVLAGSSCLINSHLTIYSNTWLDLGTATIGVTASFADEMLTNYAATAYNRTVSDGAITAAGKTLTSATANFTSADVGRSIDLVGAGLGQSDTSNSGELLPDPVHPELYAHIVSVTNSTTAVLDFAATTTVSSKLLKIYNRDHNIRITGGAIARGSNPGGNSGSNALSNVTNFHRVDYLTIEDTGISLCCGTPGANNSINLMDTAHVVIQRVSFQTFSDTVHITGPATDITVRDVSGNSADDFVAITARDWPTAIDPLGEVYGNVREVLVDGVTGASLGCCSVFRIEGAAGMEIRNVTGRNIYPYQPSGGIILDDSAFFAGATIDNVLIDGFGGVNLVGTTRNPEMIDLWAKTIGSVTLRNVAFPNTVEADIVDVGLDAVSGATVQSLVLDGFSGSTSTVASNVVVVGQYETVQNLSINNLQLAWNLATGNNGTILGTVNSGGTVNQMNVGNVSFTAVTGAVGSLLSVTTGGTITSLTGNNIHLNWGSPGGTHFLDVAAGTLGNWAFNNLWMNGGNNIVYTHGSATPGIGALSNLYVSGNSHILEADGGSLLDLTLNNVSFPTSNSVGYSSSANVTIRGAGFSCSGCSGVGRSGSQVIHVVNRDFPADVSTLTQANGDVAFNTNAALGTLGAAGPVISDGTHWHLMSNPALVF